MSCPERNAVPQACRGSGITIAARWTGKPSSGESSETAQRGPEQDEEVSSNARSPYATCFAGTGVGPLRGEASGEIGPAQHSGSQPSPGAQTKLGHPEGSAF